MNPLVDKRHIFFSLLFNLHVLLSGCFFDFFLYNVVLPLSLEPRLDHELSSAHLVTLESWRFKRREVFLILTLVTVVRVEGGGCNFNWVNSRVARLLVVVHCEIAV